jgi:putative intracellular protease/amidase
MRKKDKYLMAIVVASIILAMAVLANAAQITLAWEPDTPVVDGYSIYPDQIISLTIESVAE